MTVEEAQKILKNFTCLDLKASDSSSEKATLRQAILLLASLSDYQMLGICASSITEGFLALETYLKALGYQFPSDRTSDLAGPVYIKFNGLKSSHYVADYTGTYRGVLVSCQSAEAGGINDTYGHFPLDLFVD